MNMNSSADGSEEEQSWLQRLDAEAIQLNTRLNYFSLADNTSAEQVQGFINELDTFLAEFWAWGVEADKLQQQGRPTFAQRLSELIQRVKYNLQTYQLEYNDKVAWERYQQQEGQQQGGLEPPY